MPKKAKELKAVEVKRLPPGDHAVGGVAGLTLQHREGGARSWILRILVEGKRRELGLGSFPEVPLVAAREAARDLADRVKRRGEGAAVLKERAPIKKPKTFREACEAWLEVKLIEIKDERNRGRYRTALAKHAYPALGDKPVAEITLGRRGRCAQADLDHEDGNRDEGSRAH